RLAVFLFFPCLAANPTAPRSAPPGPSAMLPPRACPLLTLLSAPPPCPAGELRLHPADIPLTGPRATQQLLLVEEESGRATADRTSGAKFVSADAKVASVDDRGMVRPVGDGETVITATANGKTASAK